MVYPLLALAVLAIVIVLEKGFVFWKRTRLPSSLVDLAETYGFGWDELERQVTAPYRRPPPAWWVESRAGDGATLIEKALGRWLWVLETIVKAAPLLGLLGTIT